MKTIKYLCIIAVTVFSLVTIITTSGCGGGGGGSTSAGGGTGLGGSGK